MASPSTQKSTTQKWSLNQQLPLDEDRFETSVNNGYLKPPPPMPRGESFDRKTGMKRSVWGGRRRTQSCDFDPFKAAIEKVMEESITAISPARGDYYCNGATKLSFLRKMLPYPRSSFLGKSNRNYDEDHSTGSSSVSSTARSGSVLGSPSVKRIRPYKYNGWAFGCLGFHKDVGLHKFVAP